MIMGTATKQQNKVPELRFSEFSGEWKMNTIKNMQVYISDGNYGEMYPKANEMKMSGVPFIRANNMSRGKVVWTDMKYIDEKLHSVLTSGHLKADDILITTRGEIGSVAYVTKEFNGANINAQLCLLRVDGELSSKFLFSYLTTQQAQKQFKELQTGSALKQLPKGNLAKVQVKLPPYQEQQKIADFIGSVDDWLDNLRQQKTALETYKRGMMQKLFTQQVRFKDENGKYFPEWEEKELGEVFNAVKGSGISKEQLDTDGKNECILYGELYTTYSEQVFEVKSKTNVTKGTLSNVGDLLVPCSTTTTAIDLANVTALNKKDVLLGGDITVLRGKDKVSSVFYAYYLSNHKKRELAKYGQGVTIIHVYYSHFKDMLIDVPSLAEQQKIAYFLTSIDESIESKQQQIAKAEEWKKGLMQKMFI